MEKQDDLKEFFTDMCLKVNPKATQEQIDKEYIRFLNHVTKMAKEYFGSLAQQVRAVGS